MADDGLLGLLFAYYMDASSAGNARLMAELEAFRTSPEAWSAADTLLQQDRMQLAANVAAISGDPGGAMAESFANAVYLFAAQTLREKALLSFEELPNAEARGALRDAVLQHIQNFAKGLNTHHGRDVVATLAQCLSVIAVRMYALPVSVDGSSAREWLAPIDDCAHSLSGGLESALALLEILRTMTELFDDKRFRAELPRGARREFDPYMASQGPVVLGVLTTFLSEAQAASESSAALGFDPIEIQKSVFSCLAGWIFVGEFSPTELISNPLVMGAFDAIRVSELLDVSAEVIIGLCRQTSNVERFPNEALTVITQVLGMQPMWDEALVGEDEDVLKAVAVVFAEVGEIHAKLIVRTHAEFLSNPGAYSESHGWAQAYVAFMLQITAYRGEELVEIPDIPLQFWYRLYKELLSFQKGQASASSGFQAASARAARPQPLFPSELLTLLTICVHLSRIPSAAVGDDVVDPSEVADFRLRVADTMADMAHLLDGSLVGEHLVSLLHAVQDPAVDPSITLGVASSPPSNISPDQHHARVLQAVEAVLFALRSVFKYFDSTARDAITPGLVENLSALASQPVLSPSVLALAATWGPFVKGNPAYAANVFSLVFSSLTLARDAEIAAPSDEVRREQHAVLREACSALTRLCHDAADELAACGFAETLLQFVDSSAGTLDFGRRLDIIEAALRLVSAVCSADFQQASTVCLTAFDRVAGGSLQQLQEHALNPQRPDDASACLINLKVTFRFLTIRVPAGASHPLLPVIQETVWPIFSSLLSAFGDHENVIEKLCNAIRYMVKLLGDDSLSIARDIAHALLSSFRAYPFDALIYAANEVLGIVGNTKSSSPNYSTAIALVGEIMSGVQSVVLPRLASQNDFQEQPELVQEWMEGMGKVIRRCPLLLLQDPQFDDVLQRAYGAGLYMAERRSAESVCLFFIHLLELGLPKKQMVPSNENVAAVHDVVSRHGEHIVRNLLGGVAGFLNHDSLRHVESILELLARLLASANLPVLHSWVATFLSRIPATVLSDDDKQMCLDLMFTSDSSRLQLADARDVTDALRVIEDQMMKHDYLQE